MPEIYGLLLFGGKTSLQHLYTHVPQIKRSISQITEKNEISSKELEHFLLEWMKGAKEEQFSFSFRFKIHGNPINVKLQLLPLIAIDGRMEIYLGCILSKCFLQEPWNSQTFSPVNNKIRQVIQKIFHYYHLGSPEYHLVEVME